MTAPTRIPKGSLQDLITIREVPLETLNALVTVLDGFQSQPQIADVMNAFGRSLQTQTAESLLRQLLSFSVLAERQDLGSIEAAINSITAGLALVSPAERWTPEQMTNWQSLLPTLLRLANHTTIRVMTKALALFGDHPIEWVGGRILTDIRPVFNERTDGDSIALDIATVVITHTMRMNYKQDGRSVSIYISLEDSDIYSILDMCERAIAKSASLRAKMSTANISVFEPI